MSAELEQELSNSAAEFSVALQRLAVAIDADISKVVRNGVLRVFGNVVKRSPVDTGAYRGSHGISNMEPDGKEGIKKGNKKEKKKVPAATAKNWTWKVGDGDIWLFNNVPYAERIENGWSKQAPAGVYRMAIPEITAFINAELAKYPALSPLDEGGEK
jgi:hypothetical protein